MRCAELMRSSARFSAVAVLTGLIAGAMLAGTAHAATMVFSGVVLDQGKNRQLDDFSRWLARHARYPLESRYAESYQVLSEVLRRQRDALGLTCGAPFVQDHIADGQQLVAVPLFRGKPLYHSLVIARADAGADKKGLPDFGGGVFAFSDPRSNSGFVVPAYMLARRGVDIHRHFRFLLNTGLHENTIRAVADGLADVGNVDEYVWVEYRKKHPGIARRVRVVERFGPFPFTPVVAGAGVPPDVVARVRAALVGMSRDEQGRKILDSLGLDGFVVEPVSFYKPIADMLHLSLDSSSR